MSAFLQENRIGTLTTALGKDVLVLRRASGFTALNELFCFKVEALSTSDDLDFNALIGTHATVTIETLTGPEAFDGIVTDARWQGPGPSGWQYELTLRPWFWVTGQRRNQRIFHNLSVVQILEELWADWSHLGSPHFENALNGDYPELEYTVQYRESDLDFARRQMERHGINFHFQFTDGNHVLVLTDAPTQHEKIGTRPFLTSGENAKTDVEHFWEWGPNRRLVTGAIRLTDYNFKKPTQAMEAHRVGDATHAEGQVESYDYPGDYLDLGRGSAVAGLRTDHERGGDARVAATSDIMGLKGGRIVEIGGGDAVPGDGLEYMCLRSELTLDTQSYGSGDAAATEDASGGQRYDVQHTLLPVSEPMMPPIVTPRAVVQGPQTGVVVGEGEIDCDEYGRILVHLHWDLDEAYTMRCRVSQNWASKGWGGMVIPRIGMEVVVEFLEGDPDKPLVTGCVYNGKNDVPYALPEHKTRSTFKTDTHQGTGFNELRFEDENGREEIYVHAQKDRNEKTRHNHTERIDNNWLQSIGGDKNITVEDDHDEIVGGNMTLFVGGSAVLNTLQNQLSRFTQGIGTLATKLRLGKQPGLGRGNLVITTEANRVDATGISATDYVGVARVIQAGRRVQIEAGTQVDIHSGDVTEVDSHGTTSISAAERVTINCGESRITLEPDGKIHIHGNVVNMTANDTMELNAGSHLVLKSKRIDIN